MVRIDEQYPYTWEAPRSNTAADDLAFHSNNGTIHRRTQDDGARTALIAAIRRLNARCRAFILVHPECGPIIEAEVGR